MFRRRRIGCQEKETLKKRISNNECRMSNIEVRYSVYFIKDRAQRFYPSKFCGSTFDILRFAVFQASGRADPPAAEHLTPKSLGHWDLYRATIHLDLSA